jgi:DNA-binding transcriptional regulator YdaS (Cro superfamily)
MKLLDYTLERGGQIKLAREINVPTVSIHHWAHGIRPVPAHAAVAIERATAGAVTRKDLRPNDWADIWPELIEKEAA